MIVNEINRNTELENALCPICGVDNGSTLLFSAHPFKVVKCARCSLMFLSPRLTEKQAIALYSSEYFTSNFSTGYMDYSYQEYTLRLTFRRFLKKLKKYNLTGGDMLEIGCGYGFFLSEAEGYFSSLSGTELSPSAALKAKENTSAEIYTGGLEAIPPNAGTFDTIISLNVIEHIYSPLSFIMSIKERLSRNGNLILATPDAGSFWFRIMKRKWPSLKAPEHIAFYTKKTLTRLLENTGFHNFRDLSYLHAFPLGLILNKLGIHLEGKIARTPLWLPKTMLAIAAEKK